MKRIIDIVLRAIIIASIVLFIGSFIYKYTDYKQHPDIYMINSAPWYVGLQIQGIITLIVDAVCIIILAMMRRKEK